MHVDSTPDFALPQITVTLEGNTAWHLLMALKEGLAHGDLDPTSRRVYDQVVDAIVAGIDAVSAPSKRQRERRTRIG